MRFDTDVTPIKWRLRLFNQVPKCNPDTPMFPLRTKNWNTFHIVQPGQLPSEFDLRLLCKQAVQHPLIRIYNHRLFPTVVQSTQLRNRCDGKGCKDKLASLHGNNRLASDVKPQTRGHFKTLSCNLNELCQRLITVGTQSTLLSTHIFRPQAIITTCLHLESTPSVTIIKLTCMQNKCSLLTDVTLQQNALILVQITNPYYPSWCTEPIGT